MRERRRSLLGLSRLVRGGGELRTDQGYCFCLNAAVAAIASAYGAADLRELHEGWAWALGRTFEGGGIFSLVGLTDDPPMAWQVHSYARRNRPKLLGGIKSERLEQEIRVWCEALHSVLTDDPSVRSIRWYDHETFDRNHGETWFDTPAD
jgi:hypothetical protein